MALLRARPRLWTLVHLTSIHTMRPTTLRTLTWATVAAAVVSALWLAAVEPDPGAMLRVTVLPAALRPPGGPSEPRAATATTRLSGESALTRQQRHR